MRVLLTVAGLVLTGTTTIWGQCPPDPGPNTACTGIPLGSNSMEISGAVQTTWNQGSDYVCAAVLGNGFVVEEVATGAQRMMEYSAPPGGTTEAIGQHSVRIQPSVEGAGGPDLEPSAETGGLGGPPSPSHHLAPPSEVATNGFSAPFTILISFEGEPFAPLDEGANQFGEVGIAVTTFGSGTVTGGGMAFVSGPTLGSWAMGIFAVLLAGTAALVLRSRGV